VPDTGAAAPVRGLLTAAAVVPCSREVVGDAATAPGRTSNRARRVRNDGRIKRALWAIISKA
jgi:hypothetical protein